MIHLYSYKGKNIAIDINSGAIHLLDELSYDLLSLGREFEEKKHCLYEKYPSSEIDLAISELNSLIEKDLLYSNDVIKVLHSNFPKKKTLKAMCLHVCHDCNLRCEYCFASQGDFQGSREMMSLETGKKALEFLAKNSDKRRNLEVDFFGGEPLMNFDVVKELVFYARELEKKYDKNFRLTLTTNCLLLNDEVNAFLNEHISNVVLSIDGRKETNDRMRKAINGSGSYEIIIKKIKKFIESRGDKSYYVRGTFTRKNLDFSKDIIHLAKQDFYSLSMEPVVAERDKDYSIKYEDLPFIKKEYENLIDSMLEDDTIPEFNFFHFNIDLENPPCAIKRASGCGAGTEYISVTPKGEIYPCHQFVGNDKFIMGNLFTGISRENIVDMFSGLSVYDKKECNECFAKYFCSGGCHANAWNENQNLKVPYELGCELERKRLELAIYYKIKKMEEKNK